MSVKFSNKTRQIVFKKTNGYCAYCGQTPENSWDTCFDHMIPKTRGGSNKPDNLIISCRPCNLAKFNYDMDEFLVRTLKKLTEAVNKSITNRYRIETIIRRHGESDQTAIRLILMQSDFDCEVGILSKMVGNIVKWL